ncbi:MAG: ankyrin repeat domain-containing protein [Bacteroidales bacterium]|nr:ankyrin repeat domain-containing protein [Bacteroidales bacterium]
MKKLIILLSLALSFGSLLAQNTDLYNLLTEACRFNDYEMAKMLIEEGADVNEKDYNGYTPLHIAVERESAIELVRLLIDKGADVNAAISENDTYWPGYTPVLLTLQNGYLEIAKLLIENGADVNAKTSGESNSIYIDPAYTFLSGYSALHLALKNEYFDIARLLIEKGADANAKTSNNDFYYPGYTPLHFAIQAGNTDIAKLIIKKGADLSVRLPETSQFPNASVFEFSCVFLDTEISRLLISKNYYESFTIDYEYNEFRGSSPLHLAVLMNDIELVALILDIDTCVSKQNSLGLTAGQLAKNAGFEEAYDYITKPDYKLFVFYHSGNTNGMKDVLKKNKSLYGLTNANGETVWDLAVMDNNIEVLQLLLKNKKLVNTVNSRNQNVLFTAILKNNIHLALSIIESGIDCNHRDNMGMTPYFLSKNLNNDTISNALLTKNVDTSVHIVPKLTVNFGEPYFIWAVAWSHDDRLIALGYDNGSIQIFEASTGRLIRSLDRQNGSVIFLSFTSDDQRLISVTGVKPDRYFIRSEDNSFPFVNSNIVVWDINYGFMLNKTITEQIVAAEYLSDKSCIATVDYSRNNIKVWSCPTLDLISIVAFNDSEIKSIDYSSDSGTLMAAGGNNIAFIDATNFDVTYVTDSSCYYSHTKYIENGRQLINNCVYFDESPEWDNLVYNPMTVFDVKSKQNIDSKYNCTHFQSENTSGLSVLGNYNGITLYVDYNEASNIVFFVHTLNEEKGLFLSFGNKAPVTLVGDYYGFRWYNYFSFPTISISHNGKFLIADGNIYSTNDGKKIASANIPDVKFDAVNGYFNKPSYLWGENLSFTGVDDFGDIYNSIEFYISSCESGCKTVLDSLSIVVDSLKYSLKSNADNFNEIVTVYSSCVNLKKQLIAFSDEIGKVIYIYDFNGFKIIKKLSGHADKINDICFSNDGSMIASCANDGLIKIWDISKGTAISFKSNTKHVSRVQFFDNDRKVISASEDGVIIYWDIATQKQLAAIYPVSDSLSVVVTPEGYFDGTPQALKYLYYVQGLDVIPLEAYYEQFYRPNLLQRILRGESIEQSQVDFNKRKPNSGVKITEPAQGDYRSINMPVPTNANLLKLKASFTDNGGGVEEVRVYRNNKLVQSEMIGLNKPGESISRSFDVPLMPGINTITVSVFNKDRTEICDTIKMNFSGKITEMPDLYLICVGINEYENPKYHLNFAVSDALSFSQAIETGAKTLFGNIYTYTITDRDATKANITKTLSEVQSKAKPWDVFVFYYAGHGAAISEEGRTNFYFINSDVTNIYSKEQLTGKAISNSELLFFSRDIQAEKQFLVIDACNSGAAGDLLAYRSGPEEERAIAVLARSTGTHFLFASTADQLAKEIPEIGHGVFTYSILKAMTGGDGMYSGGKSLTVKDISNYTEKQVPQLSVTYTPTKTPQYPTAYSYGQDFPLVIIGNLPDLKTLKGKYDDYSIEQLEEMKKKAAEEEDYVKANELKQEIEKRNSKK